MGMSDAQLDAKMKLLVAERQQRIQVRRKEANAGQSTLITCIYMYVIHVCVSDR